MRTMSTPRVSVLLPIYNGSAYLRQSIASVLSQTAIDFELVMCDDGSTDISRAIAASFDDPRVRLIVNEANRGLFPTLNRLVGVARGSHIRFWAQDDVMKPQCLASEERFWSRHPSLALTYCQAEVRDESRAMLVAPGSDPTPAVIEPWLSTQIAFYYGCMQGNIAMVTVRKDILEQVGPFADLRVSGDFEMWTRIALQHRIGFIREPLVELRSHDDQFSRRGGERLHFIREDRPILNRLLDAMPPELRAHAENYRRRKLWVWNVHYVMRCILTGNFSLASSAAFEIRQEAPFPPLLVRWMLTANGRLWKPKARYLAPRSAVVPFSATGQEPA
jgi:glycosyltransferase involved in cell wall biosynthesis